MRSPARHTRSRGLAQGVGSNEESRLEAGWIKTGGFNMTEQKKASLEGLFHPLRSDGKPYDSEDPLPDPMETIKVGLNRQQEDFVRESKYWRTLGSSTPGMILKAGSKRKKRPGSRKRSTPKPGVMQSRIFTWLRINGSSTRSARILRSLIVNLPKTEAPAVSPVTAEIWKEEGSDKVLVRLFDGRVFSIEKPLNLAGRPEAMIGFLKEILSRYMHDAMILANIYSKIQIWRARAGE
jgi:hypothetical protein